MDEKKFLRRRLCLLLILAAVMAVGAGIDGGIRKANAGKEETAAFGIQTESVGTEEEETEEDSESSMEKDKTETVYIKSDAEGNTKEITVETMLKHSSDGADILDRSNLTNIRNTKGDEEYSQGSDGSLIWENKGEDISYKGTSDQEPPVKVKVSYYLDGEPISPANLAGKSGRVKIRFDYENTASQTVTVKKKEYEIKTPFLAVSALTLSSDLFSNIEVTNGKLVQINDQNMVIGYAMPGLVDSLQLSDYEVTEDIEIPEYVEVTADVKEFELEFTATVITPGLLEDFDTEDLEDADEFADGMDELKDGVDDMDEGVGELYDGLKEFYDYLDEYTSGVTKIRDATKQLWEGISKLDENSKALTDGAAALQSGLEQLQTALKAAGGAQESSGDTEADRAAAAGQAAFAKTVAALGTAVATDPETEEGKAQQEALAALGLTAEDAQNLAAYAKSLSEAGALAQELTKTLQTTVDTLSSGSKQLTEGLTAYTGGVSQLNAGAQKVVEGGTTLCTAGGELYDAFGEALDGVSKLRDGVKDFKDDGIAELTKLGGSDFRNVINRLRAVKEADDSYQTFAGLAEGKTGSVRFIVETEEIKK